MNWKRHPSYPPLRTWTLPSALLSDNAKCYFWTSTQRHNGGAGLDRAIASGWLVLHESGTFVKFTQAGADLFA